MFCEEINFFCDKVKKTDLKKILLAVNFIYRLVEHAMKKIRRNFFSKDYKILFLKFLYDCYQGINSYEPLKKPFQPIQPP
jgi:hypothetical protein